MSRCTLRPYYWLLFALFCTLPAASGCQRAFVLRGSWCFDWLRGCQGCGGCDQCTARPALRGCKSCAAGACDSGACGSSAVCTTGKCSARPRRACRECTGKFPRLFHAFKASGPAPCNDAPLPHSPYDPAWSAEGPGNFHPVPTRPVFGAQPTPASSAPGDREMFDAGTETLPLRDLPRNLNTPSDPRNVLPPPDDTPEAPPAELDVESGQARTKLRSAGRPIVQTGWRPRRS